MRWIARILAVVLAIGLYHKANAQVGMGPGPGMVHSAGGGFTPSCSQSSTFLAAATGVTLTADKTNYDTLICGLVTDGMWNFDVLYIWAAPTSATALINLANPGTFNGTTNGTVSFTAYQGFTGDASTFYIDSGFNPFTASSPNFVQNSATAGIYVLNARATGAVWDIGCITGSCDSLGLLFSPYVSGNLEGHLNTSTAIGGGAPTSSQGAWNLTRTASTGSAVFLNSTETPQSNAADTSAAPINKNIIFFSFGSGFGFSNDQMAAGWIGKGVGGVGVGSGVNSCKVNNRINTYMASLSVPKNVYSNSAC